MLTNVPKMRGFIKSQLPTRSIIRNAPPWLAIAASLLICFGVWRWANGVLVPAYTARAIANGRPIGNNSDLYPEWLTAREVLLHRKAPYSIELTREIQKGFYGRELDEKNPTDPKNLQAFVYPLYVIFLLSPTITFQFSTVALIFRIVLLFCAAASVPLWMQAIRFHHKQWLTASLIILTLSTFPASLKIVNKI